MTQITDPSIDVYNGWSNAEGRLDFKVDYLWGKWTHYAIVSEGHNGNLQLFVNGELLKYVPDSSNINPVSGLYICHWPFWGSDVHSYTGFLPCFLSFPTSITSFPNPNLFPTFFKTCHTISRAN